MAKRGPVTPKSSVGALSAFLDLHGAGGRGRRSSLSRWMRANHDEFAAMLAAKEPGWNEVSAWLGTTAGLLDGNGRPPTGERVRKVWWETRRDRLAAQAALQDRSQSQTTGKNAPLVRVIPEADLAGNRPSSRSGTLPEIRSAAQQSGWQDDPGARPQPGPVTPAGNGVADPAPPSVQAAPAGSTDEQLRQVLEAMERGSVPIPKPVR